MSIIGSSATSELRKAAASNKIPTSNYIFFHHLNKGITIPVDPENITDSMTASWASSTPLSRSAPIYSYQNSGPRTVQFNFTLHRDLVKQFNPDWLKSERGDVVDRLIDELEACVLPDYKESGKIVNPPIVSVQIRDEIYIKGVIQSVGKAFKLPIIKYDNGFKYALVDINFSVSEVTPYSASIIPNFGGNRPHDVLKI